MNGLVSLLVIQFISIYLFYLILFAISLLLVYCLSSKHRCYCTEVLLLCSWMEKNLALMILCCINSLLILSSGMVNRTLSRMCGRLYFPIFLFRVGLFTLMYISSLMVLAMLCTSLPIIWKFFIDVLWPLLF